uniref:Uncharacterized protein n=1 Tax=Anguilla anguilla TaxID=7936 RepID=A0A0E9VXP6_ANGAN
MSAHQFPAAAVHHSIQAK